MLEKCPNKDQIISSNNYGLKALNRSIRRYCKTFTYCARYFTKELKTVFKLCDNVDLIVTLGGASVGDYDLVHSTAKRYWNGNIFFIKLLCVQVSRLWQEKLAKIPILGLPGNPVSALVCGTGIF